MNRTIATVSLLALGVVAANATLVPTSIVKNFDAPVEATQIKSLATLGEARLGNRGISGDYELDVQDFTKAPTGLTTAQRSWVDAQSYNFNLSYTASNRLISLTVGGVTVSNTLANSKNFETMWVRVRGDIGNGINTSVSGLKLKQDFGSGVETRDLFINNLSSPQFGFTANALKFSGLDETRDFSLLGSVAFDWTNASVATGSRGAVQFKIGEAFSPEPVPEPATMAVLGLGALGLIRRRAKKA